MKQILILLLMIICWPSISYADWAVVPLDRLIQESDLIVVGTLHSISEEKSETVDTAFGFINVQEVIWGDSHAGDQLKLKWQNPAGLICPRIEHKYNQDKKGIWLLTFTNGREVSADYPGRFISLDGRQKVVKALHKNRVITRSTTYSFQPDQPVNITIILRNPSDQTVQFPGLEYRNNSLYISKKVNIKLIAQQGGGLIPQNPLSDRIVISKDIEPIVIAPNQEHRFEIIMTDLFALTPTVTYTLNLKIDGFGQAEELPFNKNAALPQAFK